MGKKKILNKENKIKTGTFFFGCLVIIVLAAAMTVTTVYFYQLMKKQLFAERQSHLIELTQKVSEVINSEIEDAQNKADSVKNLMTYTKSADEQELLSILETISKVLELQDGVVFAMDSRGRYYSSELKTGYWEKINDLAVDDVEPKVRELNVFGKEQACMVFFRQLDTPMTLGNGTDTLTHVAVVIPIKNMENTFSMSVFDNECFTYLIKDNGRRLYKQTSGDDFIEDINVLNALSKETFVMGGDIDDVTKAVEDRSPLCLEFESTERGENYFVSMVPVSDSAWTVLLFVPTKVIGFYTSSILNTVLKYFAGIAIAFCGICGFMIYIAGEQRNSRKMMLQQEENNKLLEQAAEEARRSNAAKSEFLSRMSHDIRTPINGIIGMTNIAIKSGNDVDRIHDCLSKVSDAAEHLLMLVNDVLDMSSIESGKIEIMHENMDIRKVIGNCVNLIDGQLLSRQIEFKQEFGDFEHPFVLGDELHLRQIFINILGNAVKFTPEGGTITFRAEELQQEGDKVLYRFECIDTGIGMSEEFQTKIFEAFSQEKGGSRTDYKGTGLGMAITKKFVDRMGGTISLESTQGQGSHFTVELAFDIASDNPDETVGSESWSIDGMRVLLVEDNELNMEIAQEILREEGVIVTAVENGKLAADLFIDSPEGTFDAILMDVMMPVMNGYEATRAIRSSSHPEAKTIPVIAMTANAYAQDVQAAKDAGMNEHVAKPIELEHLFSVLNHYRRG